MTTPSQVVHELNNIATQFASHPSPVAASGLPIAMLAFVPGLRDLERVRRHNESVNSFGDTGVRSNS